MPIPIIFDTDMDTDCDDVGALAMLHALADSGEAEILGVVCNAPTPWAAPCVEAINAYYGRSHLPVGALPESVRENDTRFDLYRSYVKSVEDGHPHVFYNRAIASASPYGSGKSAEVRDGVRLYRSLLAGQPDRSVVIAAVGFLTALDLLLDSGPDEYSPLGGRDLVRAKVRMLVTMGGGSFPEGRDTFNWWMDRRAADRVLRDWPTPLAVSEWGERILTGASLSSRTPEANPVRRAYELYLQGPGRSRCSWDQVAVLYAVRGTGNDFTEVEGYQIDYVPDTGDHRWLPAADPATPAPRIHLRQSVPDGALAETIEELMTRPPGKREHENRPHA